mmetsp:Transcript_23849/g.24838  ORF Transcript_23849/g.24838 Transcript_23849/m.24838 type:complete len:132 (-) Transcript_23849:43-438(-)
MSSKSTYSDYTKILRDDINELKASKTLGLFRLALEKNVLQSLRQVMKIYFKLSMTELVSITNIPQIILLKYLKRFLFTGELNFKIDEMNDEIEFIIDNDREETRIDKLKEAYQKMNSLQLEVIDCTLNNNN